MFTPRRGAASALLLSLFACFSAKSASAQEVSPDLPPLAGWHDGLFYLRDPEDNFRLYVQGRVHVDGVGFFGPAATAFPADQALRTTLYLRRARLELSGELLQRFQWQLSGEFASTGLDNVAARNAGLDCAVDAKTSAETCSTRSSAVDTPTLKPAPTDAFINYTATSWLNIQAGQFLLPFTLENRMGDNTTPFIERSIPVRLLGAPTQRDLGAMVWGEAPDVRVYYSAGIYNGDGPNRLNVDNRFDFVGRIFTRPLAGRDADVALKGLQIGASGRHGNRDKTYVGYDAPALTTQGGYAFWKPTYRDSQKRLMHILPSGDQDAVALDLYVPFSGVELTGELVYSASNTREAVDGYQLSAFTERLGTLNGYSYYAQAGYWLTGNRSAIGAQSYGKPLHADLTKASIPPLHGVQVLAKLEQLHLTYKGAARAGASDTATPNGDIDFTAISFGVNYWATKHVRLTANYIYEEPPGRPLHEASVRMGVQF